MTLMKDDLRAGIKQFVAWHSTIEEVQNDDGILPSGELVERLRESPWTCFAHESPAVRRRR